MDKRRFDAIARFLDEIQTRRGTLRSALAGGIFNDGDGIVVVDAQSSVTDNVPNNCVRTDACGA